MSVEFQSPLYWCAEEIPRISPFRIFDLVVVEWEA
jgi:hypothetical protein